LAAGALVLAAGPSEAASQPAAKTLSGTRPDWATAAADKGAAPASTSLTARVYLAGQNPAGLAAYAQAVSTPGNADYGKYLTPTQVQQRYGATAAQVSAVTSWLTKSGLKVLATTEHYIEVSGSANAVDKAFDTQIHRYNVNGGVHHAPDSNVVVPGAVSSAVLGVTGLTDVAPKAQPTAERVNPSQTSNTAAAATATSATGSFPSTQTCSAYWGQKPVGNVGPATGEKNVAYDECSFYPSQLRNAYGITASGLTGKGATIAIVDAYGSSTMLADANQYSKNHGDKPFRPGQYKEVVTPSSWEDQDECGGPDGWAPEEALDVEMAHGLAPDANVVYVGANSCTDQDLLDALSDIVDHHLANVVSNSWDEIMHSTEGDITASDIAAYEQVFEQGAVEGIGFDFAAGDCGDNSPAAASTGSNCDPTTTEAQTTFPSADPWVTSVGGTALGISNAKGTYGFETTMGTHRSALSSDGSSWTPWPSPFYFGGGGGTSQDFSQPWYQKGVVPGSLAHTLMTGAHSASARRVTPDVAVNGDLYTSVLVGLSDGYPYSEAGYGGTSVSTPEFSAIQADAIQAQHDRSIGFANPEIYKRDNLFRDVVNEQALHHQQPLMSVFDYGIYNGALDVRLITFGEDTSLQAVPGYDDATGVGSPTEQYLNSFKTGRF
jgi:subtilase family serine protease